MAIGTDARIEFFGDQDSLDDTSGSVADAAFSVAGDLLTWTNDDDADEAGVILECAYATAPDANSTVTLLCQHIDIQSTNDSDVPTANFLSTVLGSFKLKDVTTTQFIPIRIDLPNIETSQQYKFFIRNNGGQTMSAGWDIHITPISKGPHA